MEYDLILPSGKAANAGLLSDIALAGDLVVSAALNHASIIDGTRLSKSRVEVVPHNDPSAVARVLKGRAEPHAWVVVESYYSMDADGPNLTELRTVCDDHGAGLVVDEAHALGVMGPQGRGRCAEAGVRADVFGATSGMAVVGKGAFVAGRALFRPGLWN